MPFTHAFKVFDREDFVDLVRIVEIVRIVRIVMILWGLSCVRPS